MPESQACNFVKQETLVQVCYWEFCEISKNTFFTEHLWTTSSKFIAEMLIFRSSGSQMFFKISVLKNFAILEPLSNKPSFTNTYGGCFWIFVAAIPFLKLNMVFIADNGTGLEGATRGVLLRKGVLRSFAKLTGRHKCHSLFFNKVYRPQACNFIKEETLAQVLSCEFSEISKNTFFTEHLRMTASTGFGLDSFENTS